jgi:hypothetical protein
MNPLNSKFLVEHPKISKAEFKPVENKDGSLGPSKILRVFRDGYFSEDATLRFEDGPGNTFILRVSSLRIYQEATEKTVGHLGVEEKPLGQATVNKIEKPTAEIGFDGVDFVIFEGSPQNLKEWTDINLKNIRPPV